MEKSPAHLNDISKIFKPKSENEILKAMHNSMFSLNDFLDQSTEIGFLRGVQLALQMGAYVNAYNGYALRVALQNGHLEIVKVLLEAGADVDVYDNYPLRWALEGGHTEVIKLLLKAGARNYNFFQRWLIRLFPKKYII